jgi:cytochrome c peroxidase
MKRKYIWIYSFYAAAIAATVLCFTVNRIMTGRRHAYTPEDLTKQYAQWGIEPSTMKEFVALPSQVPHDINAAEIGADLFQSRKLSPFRRSCATCHPLNQGGADGSIHSGVFTRPAMNAVFGTAYLHDGSIKDFPSLIKHMIEHGSFAAAGSLSNALVNINDNGRMKKIFTDCYGDGGFSETNLVDAIVNYSRTLMTANGPFDRFCGGRDALSPERLKGFEQFRNRRCARCHSGPSLGTRVVTEKGERVPSLRGLSKRRIYQGGGNIYSDLAAAVAMMPDSDFEDDEKSRLALLEFLRCL